MSGAAAQAGETYNPAEVAGGDMAEAGSSERHGT
jgi:hypothetical protein